jgi:uronate dehydrogenase
MSPAGRLDACGCGSDKEEGASSKPVSRKGDIMATTPGESPAMSQLIPLRHASVLMSGAAGKIGSSLRRSLAGCFRTLRLSDIRPVTALGPGEEEMRADLRDIDGLVAAMQGVNHVLHFGGIPTEASWDEIAAHNLTGTFNVFEAARIAGVRRVIFASSNHAVGFYRADRDIYVDDAPRPDSRYGLSKVAGEAIARLYFDKHGIESAMLRIGSFREKPLVPRELATWLSPADLARLVLCCLEAPALGYRVLYGVSKNTRARWRNPDDQRSLGYAPQDDAERYAAEILASAHLAEPSDMVFSGGKYAFMELQRSPDQISEE